MLNFFKALFKKKEEKIEKIPQNKLKEFFLDKVKELEEKIKEKKESYKNQLISKIAETRHYLKLLEEAKLPNPKITVRELQFMEGNRRSYIHSTNILLRQLEGILEHDTNFFLQSYHEYVSSFIKSTTRAYTILQEFFAHESKDVALRVKEIDKIVLDLSQDGQIKSLSQIESIKKELASIENKEKKKSELKEAIERLSQELSKLQKEKEELNSRKQQMLDSNEYKLVQELESKKQKAEEDIKNLKNELYHFFSPLERQLRKYQRVAIENEKLLEHYLTDPINALIRDFHLKIADVFEKLSDLILQEKPGFKEKESKKVLEILNKLSKAYLTDFVKKYTSALTNKELIDKEIRESRITQEIEEVDEKLEDLSIRIEGLSSRISAQESEFDSISLPALIEKAKQEIEKLLNFKIALE
jgi:hypothetical protein